MPARTHILHMWSSFCWSSLCFEDFLKAVNFFFPQKFFQNLKLFLIYLFYVIRHL